MNQRKIKKIRRFMRRESESILSNSLRATMQRPLRSRLWLAWRIVRGR